MRIATWNVNSIRARLEHVLRWVERSRPDVLCLQELKVQDADFPADAFLAAGYRCAVAGQKTYNGVAVLSREEPADAAAGLGHLPAEHPLNMQRRLLAVSVGGIRVISAYLPNGEAVGSEVGVRFLYRDWRDGWAEGQEEAKGRGLYRQNYCGCLYSEAERYAPRKKKAP